MNQSYPIHPRGTRARVLLTSVYGPYAQDDEDGSRTINPMELYHNQVTRIQGVSITPDGTEAANPTFDVTPYRYITAIITEKGIIREPYGEGLKKVV